MGQNGGGFDGMQYNGGGNVEVAAAPKVPPPNYYAGGDKERAPAILKTIALVIRCAAILLTLISTAVMGAAKQTVTLNDDYGDTADVEVKSTQSAAFVYFLVINPLVFAYSVGSLVASILRRAGGGGCLKLLLAIGDVVVVAMLFSANGAAVAITSLLENGQKSELGGWGKMCFKYDVFCSRLVAAVVLSTLTATLYVLLAVLSAVALRRSN
ncbi:CASP-like protein 1E1 [Curcuma longa]|uniref:CASP-like protein 1E1 n=1 Tax=Curcuma longa TaxID=136217 RepID=UPI003D9E794B